MSYQLGDKKNILGHRLSNRYLSSDAFTSSAGKTGGRSISRLGSLFKGHKNGRRFSGTGQEVGLFELKNIFLKLIFVITCLMILSYTLPFTRYGIHGFFARKSAMYETYTHVMNDQGILLAQERYVSPVFMQTDRFAIDLDATETDTFVIQEGAYVSVSPMNTLVGMIVGQASTSPQVVLFSEVGFKNNFFIKNIAIDKKASEALTNIAETQEGTSTKNSAPEVVPDYAPVAFEGLGYGQMQAKVPPQTDIPVGTIMYARTQQGLKPVGKITHIEKDNGSTFTILFAQLLTPPYAIYKVMIHNVQK